MDSTINLVKIAHNESTKILVQYEQSSQTIRYFIQKHFSEHSFTDELAAKIQSISVGVVRYQNTINFILNRTLSKGKQQELSSTDIISTKVAIFEGRWQRIPIQELTPLVKVSEKHLRKAIDFDLNSNIKAMNLERQNSLLYSHPSFLVHTLIEKLGKQEAISLMQKNNTQATAYLRVNQLVPNSKEILQMLSTKGVLLEQDKDIPSLYVIKDGLQTIVSTDAFKKGLLFIQDKASIIAVKTLNPIPGNLIWDACAAPGMKTHFLWELMKAQGHLVASDINIERLHEARERFRLYNCNEVEWIHADASTTFFPKVKKILVDAPCTSTGTLQNHPSYKWRLNKNWLFSIMTIQNKLLDGIITNYSKQPGTEILYSTCSILPHEGENQIDSVLKRFNNLELLDGPSIGQKGYPNYKCTNKVRRLFPHIHNTNGFFIAHMKIK